jgi:hypothetical protein
MTKENDKLSWLTKIAGEVAENMAADNSSDSLPLELNPNSGNRCRKRGQDPPAHFHQASPCRPETVVV